MEIIIFLVPLLVWFVSDTTSGFKKACIQVAHISIHIDMHKLVYDHVREERKHIQDWKISLNRCRTKIQVSSHFLSVYFLWSRFR